MNGKDLYDAIPYIDEKFLTERENILNNAEQNIHNNKGLKITLGIVACLCIITLIAISENKLFFYTPNVTEYCKNTDIMNKTETDELNFHGGNGDQVEIQNSSWEYFPEELQVNSDLPGKIYYLSYNISNELNSSAYDSVKLAEERLDALYNIMSLSGIKDYQIEYDIDGIYPYVQLPDAKITSFSSCFGIENSNFTNVTTDSSDSDIINRLCSDRYTLAMLQFIGIDKDNSYIYRESLYTYSREENITEPSTRQTIIKIANYSASPQELALNLQSNYIKFWITENFVENSITVSSIYGYYISDYCKCELTDYLSYAEAIELASNRAENFSEDSITACTIAYTPDLTSGTLMPAYNFFYKSNDKKLIISIPLVE